MDSTLDMLMTMHYTNLRFIIIIIIAGGRDRVPDGRYHLICLFGQHVRRVVDRWNTN